MKNKVKKEGGRTTCGLGIKPGILSLVVVLALFLLAIKNGCNKHDPDRYVFSSETSVKVDQLFTLSVQGDSTLPADGFSSVVLVAQIHRAAEGARPILFTTSAGTLRVGRTRHVDSTIVVTDLQGRATVDLVSSQEVGTARVLASVTNVNPVLTQEQNIRFTQVVLDDIITFVETPDSALANGEDISTFIVRISDGLQGDDRKVTFNTTKGAFIPEGEDGQTKVVLADADNLATAQLRSPDEVTETLVTATVKGFTQETTLKFISIPVDSIIRFTEVPVSAPADGETLSRLVVTVSSAFLREDNPTIVFETTKGSFASSEGRRALVTADDNNQATVFLRSPNEITRALMTVSVRGFIQRHIIEFKRAGPDTIAVLIEKFLVKSDEQTLIEAELIRNDGRGAVTIGTEVAFQAADSLGNNFEQGRFFNITRSNAEGKARAFFTPDGSLYRGLVVIMARPARGDTTVTGLAVLRVVD